MTELIDYEPDLIVCTAAKQREALDAIPASRPDLVITDLFIGDDEINSSHIS